MQFLSTYFTISTVRDPSSPIETPDWTLAPKRSSYHEQPLDSQFLARFVWHIVVFLQPDETAGSTQNTFNRASINLTPGRQRSEKSPCVGKIYVIFDSTSNVVKKNFSWNFFIWPKLVVIKILFMPKRNTNQEYSIRSNIQLFLIFLRRRKISPLVLILIHVRGSAAIWLLIQLNQIKSDY